MIWEYPDQKALVARGARGGLLILAAGGAPLQWEVLESDHPEDVFTEDLWPVPAVPPGPGLYVWEGAVRITDFSGPEGSDVDMSTEGSVRPATLADLMLFQGEVPLALAVPSVASHPLAFAPLPSRAELQAQAEADAKSGKGRVR